MNPNILFLCPHHAAKSVIAEAYFNQFATQTGLPFTATSGGTEPDEVVSPVVVDMLGRDSLDVSHHQPRHVTPEELKIAARIISFGCTAQELGLNPEQVELWNDVPMVSQQPERALIVIRDRVEQLVSELSVST